MPTYKVEYKAKGKKHTVVVNARSESSAKFRTKQMALELGFESIDIMRVKEVE